MTYTCRYVCSNCDGPTKSEDKLCNKPECRKIYERNRQARNRTKYMYGLSEEAVADLFRSQDGCCAICGKSGSLRRADTDNRDNQVLRIDHDHNTNEIRGMLCHRCNIGIGMLMDSPDLLRAAAGYLEGSLNGIHPAAE